MENIMRTDQSFTTGGNGLAPGAPGTIQIPIGRYSVCWPGRSPVETGLPSLCRQISTPIAIAIRTQPAAIRPPSANQ